MIPTKPQGAIWSDGQWKAIHHSGESILVNAGAGSGKTAVLTERILEKLKKGIRLENLIVLTFTKAAASEMKERLREKILDAINEGFALENELDFIDQANIQTFDSFALGLVKKYHYILGVNKNIGIGDKVVFTITKNKILDEIFENKYQEKNNDFLALVDLFSVKDDKNLKNYLINVSNKLDLLSDKISYLDSYLNKYFDNNYIEKNVNEYERYIVSEINNINLIISNLDNMITDESLIDHINEIKLSLNRLLHSSTYNEILENINVSLPRIPRNADFEEKEIVNYEKENIKKIIKNVSSYLTADNKETLIDEILDTKLYVSVIIDILKELDLKLFNFKKDLNSFEFIDIAKMAINIFKNNEVIRLEYKNKINEILVDEYQDTSDLQEELICLIENNNVYMVGDMKQSIYRFRNANPDIFKSKYQSFKDERKGCAIDLSQNFRSREEVLRDINKVFLPIMDLEVGGVEYKNGHMLEFGNKSYNLNKPKQNYNLELLSYKMEDYEGYTLNEVEAFICANKIKKMVEEKYQVFDKSTKTYSDAKYGDFVILTSDKSQYDLYKKVFEYFQIPLMIHKDLSFVKSDEIYVIKNILKLIYSLNDREYFKTNFNDSLYSLLRSFLVGLSDEIISSLFKGDLLENLKLSCSEVYFKLTNLSNMARKSTVGQIIAEIYSSFDVYTKLVELGNVEEKEDKLNFLLSKFNDLSQLGYNLLDCINYLESIINEDMDIEYSSSQDISKDIVNAMSIHKSKGLEFNICFFLGMASKFNTSELNDRILFDLDYGFILPVFDDGLKDTFYKTLLKLKVRKEEISERIRVLYVALTRAKEKMIIVLPEFLNPINYNEDQIPLVHKMNFNSFFSVLQSLKYKLSDYIFPAYLGEKQITKEYDKKKTLNIIKNEDYKDIKFIPVSLKKVLEEKEKATSTINKIIDKNEIEALEYGTMIHKYLELIDYTMDYIKQIKEFNTSDFIKSKLNAFFENEFIKNKDIVNTYHEYEFTYKDNETVISGIIDLILETKDELIVIDYKTSDIEKIEYQKQVNIYKSYLEKISNKHVSGYLYSIMQEKIKKV